MTNYHFSVTHFNPKDQKLAYKVGKEMHFDGKAPPKKASEIEHLQGCLNHLLSWLLDFLQFLSFDPNRLCNRLKILLQEKQAGNNSKRFDEEIVALADEILEYK